MIEEIKTTKFGSNRFIVPSDWFKCILNNSMPNQIFNNSIFLNTRRNKINKKIDKSKIIIVIYEIMDYIINYFKVDYIIMVKFDNTHKIIDLENVGIYTTQNIEYLNIKFEKIEIENAFLRSTDFSIIKKSFLDESTNQLLNEPKLNEKEKSTTIRRINTDSGKFSSSSNNNNIIEENNINQINQNNNTNNKLSVNSKNNNSNNIKSKKYENNNNITENIMEGDMNEFNSNYKFHNISQKYYRHLSLKDLTKENLKLNNKIKNEEELNDKVKKYLFNESELTISLRSFDQESIDPIGIINPSIYCFMICILQTLISIPELNYYFLSESYSNKNNKIKKSEENNNQNTPICDAYNDFIKQYLLTKKYMQIPRPLKIICNQLLGGMRMHDCQEFFVCFLEALQDELNNKEKTNIPENITMEQKWIIYRKVNYSFIDSIFTGLMRSSVQCKNCSYKSFTYDPFIDLSVSINKYKNLEKCLKQYFENEKIDCEYKCEHCKKISKVS